MKKKKDYCNYGVRRQNERHDELREGKQSWRDKTSKWGI